MFTVLPFVFDIELVIKLSKEALESLDILLSNCSFTVALYSFKVSSFTNEKCVFISSTPKFDGFKYLESDTAC